MLRFLYLLLLLSSPAISTELTELTDLEKDSLKEFVHQDCGSCHGMTLQGGLGPALTTASLSNLNTATIATIISTGRPGTPMPPWAPILSKPEILWIAQYLKKGTHE